MKDIEKIIKDRKEELDYAEPSEGHFEKFQEKLPGEAKRNFFILRIAAIVLAALFISTAIWIYMDLNTNGNRITVFSPEVQETIYYYNSLNWEMESQIMEMPIEDRREKKRIQNDLKQYEESYDQLMNDLLKFPNDERVINAIIEYHRSKTEMLEHILDQLQQRKQI